MNFIKLAKEACAPNQTFNSDPEWVERFAALVRAETLEEAAEWCEAKRSYNAMHANTEFAAGIRGLK